MIKRFFLCGLGVMGMIGLSACGDDLTPVRYEGFPYSNERTAGTGVAYVRAHMASERGPVLRSEMPSTESVLEQDIHPITTEPAPAPVAKDPLLDKAEEIFRQIQRK